MTELVIKQICCGKTQRGKNCHFKVTSLSATERCEATPSVCGDFLCKYHKEKSTR